MKYWDGDGERILVHRESSIAGKDEVLQRKKISKEGNFVCVCVPSWHNSFRKEGESLTGSS